MTYKKFLYVSWELFLIFLWMTAESTYKVVWCFDDVLRTIANGFSRNYIYMFQIRTISVNVFVDFNAVFVTIDGWCYSWLAWDMVTCQASPNIAHRYFRKPSDNTISETKGLCRPQWIRNWFEFGIRRAKEKERNSNLSSTKQRFTRDTLKIKWRYRRQCKRSEYNSGWSLFEIQ